MAKGQTYYVEHVSADLPWTTKETPDNVRTKGALKFKNCNVQIFEDNTAMIKVLTEADVRRIRFKKNGLVRLVIGSYFFQTVMDAIRFQGFWHGPTKQIGTGCGRSAYLVDIREKDVLMLTLQHRESFTVIPPNHPYFKLYDDDKARADSFDDELEDEDETKD